jgi:chemotaxis protein methyltransferase CheR
MPELLDEKSYDRLCEYIYNESGIRFTIEKKNFIITRLKKRMAYKGLTELKDYIHEMKFDLSGKELREFLDLLTTNETYFYRDISQLTVLVDEVVPIVLEQKRKLGNKKVRIWSSASSTGCEAYTLAIMLKESLKDFHHWDIEIIGTDISHSALNVAQSGLFSERELMYVPPEIRKKYFHSSGDYFRIHSDLSKFVNFKYLNLINQSAMARMRNIDIILCRNVLIYFDDASIKLVLDSLYESLIDEGYIFMGVGESLSRLSRAFKLVRMGRSLVYMKGEH